MGASALTVGLLFLYPTSLGNGHGPAPKPAPVGVVGPPQPTANGKAPASSPVVVNGAVADTVYGPVQVQLTVRAGKIVKAAAIVYPQGDRRDREINGWAIPRLNAEVLAAQSSQIDTLSGATYTSDGYRRSLQAAIDAAHL
jgi:uncharacterized protein with FMN-binding domain